MIKKRGIRAIEIFAILFSGVICCLILICVDLCTKKEEHIHSFDEWVCVSSPTCIAIGFRERYCECGEKQVSVISALGHELVTVEGKEATCTDGGYAEYVKCSRCDYSTYEAAEALGHDFGEWIETKRATCCSYGEETRVCSRDGRHIETRQTDLTDHSMSEWIVELDATCTQDGLEYRQCSVCKDKESRPIASAGHSFGEWTLRSAATCTSDGAESRICSVCSKTEEQTIKAFGHDFGKWIQVTPLSCLTDGVEERVCSHDKTHVEIRTTEKTGHVLSDWITEKEATCLTDGEEYIKCLVCSTRTDFRTVKASGHSFGGWIRTIEPTCTAEGIEKRICDRDETHTQTRAVEKLPHIPTEWINDKIPVCGEAGERHKDCKTCGALIISESVAALEHDYKLRYNANVHYYMCSRCESVRDESPHDWKDNDCGVCGYDLGGIKGLKWKLSPDGEYYILSGLGSVKTDEFQVPATHNGKPVRSIGEYAFGGFTGSSIAIPSTVTLIEYGALSDCNSLQRLKLPFIGASAGTQSDLGYIFGSDSLDNNLTDIPQSLKTIEIEEGISEILQNAFRNCTSVTEIILPESVKNLGERCFYGCSSLEKLVIPAGVETVGKGAFYGVSENCDIVFENKENWFLYDGEMRADKLDEAYLSVTRYIIQFNNRFTFKSEITDGE